MGQQHALGVLGITESVIHEIPVQGIGTRTRMAARTTLPGLETEVRAVKEQFAHALLRLDRLRSQG